MVVTLQICAYFKDFFSMKPNRAAFSVFTETHFNTRRVGRILERYANSSTTSRVCITVSNSPTLPGV